MSFDARGVRDAFTKIARIAYDGLVPACFLGFAAYAAASTANVLTLFALREPTFDQYREYAHYLSQPFLTSVFMLENGHRPVFPALIANIEITALHADQSLQLGIGSLCVALAVAIIAIVAWRHTMPRAGRAAGVMLAAAGIVWLANARMLVQGVGQLQVYLVVVSLLIAVLLTWRAYRIDSPGMMTAASFACAVAMFTFGTGAAVFPTVIALGLWLRMGARRLAIPVFAWLICLVLYLIVLPGHEAVRHGLTLRPVDSARAAAAWLSSPWANAFFGFADPPLQPWIQYAEDGAMMRAANAVVKLSGLSWPTISTAFGALGIFAFIVRTACRFARRAEPSRYETLANALCVFGLLTAAVIGLGRLDAFETLPNQVFADRYLPWTCLFWIGLALLLLDDVCRSGKRVALGAVLACCFIIPFALWPTHRSWAGWTAAVYRAAERAAAAARSNVFDADAFPNDADASRDDVLRSLAAFKAQRLAMFADPGWELMAKTATPAAPRTGVAIDAHIVSSFDDALSKHTAARVEGVVRDGLDRIRDCQLAIIDEDDRVVGIAQFSFIDRDGGIMRLHHRPKRGFDAYISDYRPDGRYRIAAIQRTSHEVLAQAPIAPAG
jgi:hypothetical protein